MKIAIVGGGPAGLYFSYLMKRQDAGHRIRVYEQNPRFATFGFGVVFSDRALEFLRGDDEDTYQYLLPHMESWPDLQIVHRDEVVAIDGNGFAAIERLELLTLLQQRCLDRGIELSFEHPVASLEALDDADLIVGSDGINSIVRQCRAHRFGASVGYLDNRFIWYGTSKLFDCLSLTFREHRDGVFCAHHYRYSPKMSTFIVECDQATWRHAGFENMDDAATRAYCQAVFAADLDDHPLVSNKSIWRRFPAIRNERWSCDNVVLMGDALRTAHFSIGSGTRLAMEDAIALAKALEAEPRDLQAALAHYEGARRPVVETIVDAAIASARWYERMSQTMRLDPYEFAHDYMTRTGRVGDTRLQQIAPRFMARYVARKRNGRGGG